MFGYQLTEGARRVLARAREEAALRCQDAVQTEHLMLALVNARDEIAARVLHRLRVDIDSVAQRLDDRAARTTRSEPCLPDLPYSHESLKALELAMREARGLQADALGTDHLILGVLGERCGLGGRVLADAGISVAAARAAIAGPELERTLQ